MVHYPGRVLTYTTFGRKYHALQTIVSREIKSNWRMQLCRGGGGGGGGGLTSGLFTVGQSF